MDKMHKNIKLKSTKQTKTQEINSERKKICKKLIYKEKIRVIEMGK